MNELDVVEGHVPETGSLCVYCNEGIAAGSRFCKHCGKAQVDDTEDESAQKFADIKQLALFFIFDAVVCCTANFIKYFRTLSWSITFDTVFAIIAVAFFCHNWSKNKSLLIWHNFSLPRLLRYITIAVAGSFIVHFFVGWLNQTLFSKEFSYYAFYSKYTYGKAMMIFFIAVVPALFEELGYRGFLLQKLLQVVDKNQAIFISAFLFAIMHVSFISLVWLLPFALFLAYLRIKENTLWYGVFVHFTFNFTVCLMELYKYR